MKSDIKEKWVKALRSGKYKQTHKSLRKGNCYCALGVLADLYAKENSVKWECRFTCAGTNRDFYEIDDSCYSLPNSIRDWAGLGRDHQDIESDVVRWNDADFLPFEDIADMIDMEHGKEE